MGGGGGLSMADELFRKRPVQLKLDIPVFCEKKSPNTPKLSRQQDQQRLKQSKLFF